MIKVENLLKVFNKKKSNEVRAIDGVTLEFPEKGLVAIYGASGSGKTTLMNALGGLDKFDGGEIIMDGNVYTKSVGDKYRIENIGYVFQNYLLDERLDVYQNVAQGLRTVGVRDEEVIFDRVMTALDNVGMRDYYKRNVTTLSGGQQQRVAIARAMVKGARIILADEPTGNLDELNTRTVMELLKAMSKNCLVIVVTHEEDIIERYADSVIEIKDGKVNTHSEGAKTVRETSDKTKIFLGDKEKKEYSEGSVQVEYFGEEKPLRLTLVNHGGRLYLACENSDVKFVDKDSEIKLVRKTRAEYIQQESEVRDLSLNTLGDGDKGKIGQVFGFGQSLKEGFANAFGKNKKRITIFTCTVIIFMAAIVFILASFGRSYYAYNNVGSEYHPKLISTIIGKNDVKSIEEFASKNNYDIEYWYLAPNNSEISISVSGFESFYDIETYFSGVACNSVEKAKESKVLAGNADNLKEWNDIAISKKVADTVLGRFAQETGFTELGYDFLLNSKTYMLTQTPIKLNVVAVVDSDCEYFYLNEALINMNALMLDLDVRYGLSAADDEIFLPSFYKDAYGEEEYHTISGKEYKVIYSDVVKERCLNARELASLKENFDSIREVYFISSDADEFSVALRDSGILVLSNMIYSKAIASESTKLYALQDMIREGVVFAIFVVILLASVSLMFYASMSLRVKEIGLYRAIGVSTKNILFKFFVESLALVIVSVVSVYLLIGLPIAVLSGGQILYLPWWLYLSSFVFMSGIICFFAVLPVMIFLRKSPVQILSKYDL